MHHDAFAFVRRMLDSLADPPRVLEIGGRDVNNSALGLGVRPLFSGVYVGLDVRGGPGVDVVADGATWPGDGTPFDLILSTETLEHAENAGDIIANAHRLLRPGGVLLLTAAGVGRAPHSALDGEALREGEYYRNVTRRLLAGWLAPFAVRLIDDTTTPRDIYALAVKGE